MLPRADAAGKGASERRRRRRERERRRRRRVGRHEKRARRAIPTGAKAPPFSFAAPRRASAQRSALTGAQRGARKRFWRSVVGYCG